MCCVHLMAPNVGRNRDAKQNIEIKYVQHNNASSMESSKAKLERLRALREGHRRYVSK